MPLGNPLLQRNVTEHAELLMIVSAHKTKTMQTFKGYAEIAFFNKFLEYIEVA